MKLTAAAVLCLVALPFVSACSKAVVPEILLDKHVSVVEGHTDIRMVEFRRPSQDGNGNIAFVRYEKDINGKWYEVEQKGDEFVLTPKGDRDLRRDNLKTPGS